MSNFVAGLIITGIGMGLVFVMIILLWGLMYLMVRGAAWLETIRAKEKEDEEEAGEPVAETIAAPDGRKARAAAAAVAVALARQRAQVRPQQSAVSVSPWQAAGRAAVLGDRASLFTRKNRGA
ncbi:MAG: OadG family protein [Longilinea sp.]|nr:OadG family protein [Longilinea sp.]MCA1955140.1 OadG family protein [Anaerolinea sp.]